MLILTKYVQLLQYVCDMICIAMPIHVLISILHLRLHVGTVMECTCPDDCTFPENVGTITITCTRSLDVGRRSDINVRSQPTVPEEATGQTIVRVCVDCMHS